MSKNQKNKRRVKKTVQPKNLGGLFIQKRIDSIGRNYFVDREGKKRSTLEYKAQWTTSGRISKESFERTLREIKKHEITDITTVRLISQDFEILKHARPLRQKEIEIMESKTSGSQLFFRATDTIQDAIMGGAEIKILSPTGYKFLKVSDVKAMDIAHKFIESINDSVEEINEASGKEITSPLLQFNFEHDVENNIFYIDFRNVTGFEDFELLNQLIRDNFDS